jgi:hypothetical protein
VRQLPARREEAGQEDLPTGPVNLTMKAQVDALPVAGKLRDDQELTTISHCRRTASPLRLRKHFVTIA